MTRWNHCIFVNLIYFACSTSPSAFILYIFFKAFRHSRVGCVIASHAVPSGGCLDMLLQIHCPDLTSWLTPPSASPLLAMRRAGFASAAHSTRAGCASSALASATPAVTEPRASQSPPWRPCASAPMAGRGSCVKSVSVSDWCKEHLTVLLKVWAANVFLRTLWAG